MSDFSLVLPADFDDYAWELEPKGWFTGALLIVDGQRYPLSFYDLFRLGQTIADTHARDDAFFEPNLVVLQAVTKANMQKAAEMLVRSGQFKLLAPE